jgi:hypothetical protein
MRCNRVCVCVCQLQELEYKAKTLVSWRVTGD